MLNLSYSTNGRVSLGAYLIYFWAGYVMKKGILGITSNLKLCYSEYYFKIEKQSSCLIIIFGEEEGKMDNKFRNKLMYTILGVMVIFPICINLIMSVRIFPNIIPVNGDFQVWVPTLGTFWGAIIGGVISGVLTLLGVNKTIQASFHSLEINANQMNEAREKELELSISKERLKELYQPVDSLHSEYIYKYAAHNFEDLTDQEQLDYIFLIDKNIVYGELILHDKLLELKWAHRAKDYQEANKLYIEINDNIFDEMIVLREMLKLPKMVRIYSLPEVQDNAHTEV